MEIRKLSAAEYNKAKTRLVSRRNTKRKMTPSLYDAPSVEKTYWGNDPGSEIIKGQVRPDIRFSLNLGHMYDFLSDDRVSKLSKADRDNLREYEFHYMTILFATDGIKEFMTPDTEHFMVVDFDETAAKYTFTLI